MTSYARKLSDPRWQRRRLEILQLDEWKCVYCRASDQELHLHHVVYRYRSEPCEYSDDELFTLCWKCHEDITEISKVAGSEAVTRLFTKILRVTRHNWCKVFPEMQARFDEKCRKHEKEYQAIQFELLEKDWEKDWEKEWLRWVSIIDDSWEDEKSYLCWLEEEQHTYQLEFEGKLMELFPG